MMRRFTWISGSPTVRKGIKAISYPFDLLRLDRELKSRAPGILHVQWALLPVIDRVFWRRWKKQGWKIVYTAHDVTGLDGTTPGVLARTSRHLFKIADAVVVHSKRDRGEVVRLGSVPSRVKQLPQGTPGLFQSAPVTREDARRTLGIDAARPCILFFGLLKPYKSLEVLLAAIALVRRDVPDVLLAIVGKPVGRYQRYERLIDELEIRDVIQWERSYVPTSRADLHFASADVVALPYRAASSSAVLFNAYSHARAVVATKVGAFPEVVEHGRTGLLVEPDSANQLAEALKSLLRDRKSADAMGARARDYAIENHNWLLIGRLTGETYLACTAGQP